MTEAPQTTTTPFQESRSSARPSAAPANFLAESKAHGWPSFRDAEVYWDNVRVLANGETVSIDGTHLGHNLPDDAGNRTASIWCRWRAGPATSGSVRCFF